MKNADYPAYPNNTPERGVDTTGLTKREYFATMAMQGLLANAYYMTNLEKHCREKVITDMNAMLVRESIDMADELLKQLEIK